MYLQLEPNELYKTEDFFLLLYPDRATAARVEHRALGANTVPDVELVEYFSREFGKEIGILERGETFLVLKQANKYCQILTENSKIGWIVYREWLNLKRND